MYFVLLRRRVVNERLLITFTPFPDNEPPALYCPANIEVEKETTTPTKKVYWPMPTYFDNTNTPVTLFTEAVNGSDFSTGEHKITYKATDQAGNKAECTFVVIISSKSALLRCCDPAVQFSFFENGD